MGTKIVCFDLGGVLVRICRTWQDALAAAGVSHSLSPEPAIQLQQLESFERHQQGLIGEHQLWAEMASHFQCSSEDAALAHRHILVEFYPGIPELLRELDEAGVPLGCLSNTNEPHWKEMTEADRFRHLQRLKHRLPSHLCGSAKPDPAIFARFEEQFGVSPAQIVFFDDTPENVSAALKRGWNAFLVDHAGDTAAQIRFKLVELGILNR